MRELFLQEGRIRLRFQWVPMGEQLCVIVTGGLAHAGAAALGGAEGVRTVCRAGHREDELCGLVAEKLSRAGIVCAVVGGVHYDAITPEEIAAAPRLAGEGAELLIRRRRGEGAEKEDDNDTA